MTYEYEQYLAHYGIKGQKWGQRRFQNEDGSLTEEGKKRYGFDGSASSTGKLTKEQYEDYNRLKFFDQENIKAMMSNGVDYDTAKKRVKRDKMFVSSLVVGAGAHFTGLDRLVASTGANALKKTISSIANSKGYAKAFNAFMKNQKYRKMGAYVLKKSKFNIGFRGLMGR